MLARGSVGRELRGEGQLFTAMRRSSPEPQEELGPGEESIEAQTFLMHQNEEKVARKTALRKKERAEERARLHGAFPGILGRGVRTFLQKRTVSTAREKTYRRAWEDFKLWSLAYEIGLESLEDLDHALTNCLNEMYFEGEDPSAAETLLAAARYFRNDVKKVTDLAQASEALRGYRKLEPPQGRLPLPFPMLCVIVKDLWKEMRGYALYLLMVWATCCRPGEALKIRKRDVVAPTSMCRHWIVILNSGKEHPGSQRPEVGNRGTGSQGRDVVRPSKVGESDEAITIDQPYLKNLGKVVMDYAHARHPHDLLFDFTTHDVTKAFNVCLNKYAYYQMGICCTYQLRHGSASTDVLQGIRSLTDIQKRGRWQTPKSVRRYSNGGRVSQVFGNLTPFQKNEAHQAEKWMQKTLGHGI